MLRNLHSGKFWGALNTLAGSSFTYSFSTLQKFATINPATVSGSKPHKVQNRSKFSIFSSFFSFTFFFQLAEFGNLQKRDKPL